MRHIVFSLIFHNIIKYFSNWRDDEISESVRGLGGGGMNVILIRTKARRTEER